MTKGKIATLMISALMMITLVSVFQAASVSAYETLEVGVEKPYATIQDAIDAASPGDTVLVYPGTYNEAITIYKSVILTSSDGPESTIIDLGGGYDSVRVTASNVRIEGFTLQNAGYFLLMTDTSNIQNDVVITNNIFSSGRVQLYSINNIDFSNNQISGFSVWRSSGSIANNLVEDALIGIALYFCDGLTIEGNTVTARIGKNTDAGIYIMNSTNIQVKSNTISGFTAGPRSMYNHGTAGAGIYVYSDSNNVTIENNDIKRNTVGVYVATKEGLSSPNNIVVNHNNIEDSSDYGVLNIKLPASGIWNYWDYGSFSPADAIVDATLNWWGTTDGNEIITMVSGNVNFSLWLDAPYPEGMTAEERLQAQIAQKDAQIAELQSQIDELQRQIGASTDANTIARLKREVASLEDECDELTVDRDYWMNQTREVRITSGGGAETEQVASVVVSAIAIIVIMVSLKVIFSRG